MTYLELYTYVTGRFSLSLSAAQIKEHINEVYKDLTRIFTPDYIETNNTISVLITARTVDLTFAARKVWAVKRRSGTTYTPMREIRKDALLLPYVAAGVPARWGIDGQAATGYLRLFVDPSALAATDISVDYEPVPATMTADGDIPKYIPVEYHHLIALGALAIGLAAQEDWQNAQYWEGRFRDEVNSMIVTLSLNAPDNFPNISKMAGGGKK